MNSGILDKVISQTYQESRQVSPAEFVNELFKFLSSREIEVLKDRYGLGGGKASTLEVIGKKLNITRERVRQIERGAIVKIKNNKSFEELTRKFRISLLETLNQRGGLISEKDLIEDFVRDDENDARALFFLLKLFENTYLEPVKLPQTNPAWKTKEVDLEKYKRVISEIKNILSGVERPISLEELTDKFKKTEYYQTQGKYLMTRRLVGLGEAELEQEDKDSFLTSILKSYINVSQEVKSNPFGEIGLKRWRSVTPKRMGEKIYLILKHAGKPMHFRDITLAINEAKFDKKIAHTPTVHNELILDNRFVLIGRGIYALKEWGYKDGVVSQIVEDVLKSAPQPLAKSEIFERVKKQRLVKDGTIYLALNNKEKYKKTVEGKYYLKREESKTKQDIGEQEGVEKERQD